MVKEINGKTHTGSWDHAEKWRELLSLPEASQWKSTFRWLNSSKASALESNFTSVMLLFLVHIYSIMSSLTVSFTTKNNVLLPLPVLHLTKILPQLPCDTYTDRLETLTGEEGGGCMFLSSDIDFWLCHFADKQHRFYGCTDTEGKVHQQTSWFEFTDYATFRKYISTS